MSANREYKSTFFSVLLSEPERLREVYNAIANTNYGEDVPIEINTLKDVFYKGLENDISFIIDGKFVVLLEHQSTINKNMPLRCLMYISAVYKKIVDMKAAFRVSLIKIPAPEFIVLYNGEEPFPEEETLHLSDAYIAEDDSLKMFGNLDLTVRVLNINPQYNQKLLHKSETLKGYSSIIARVRQNKPSGIADEEAIDEAIKWGIENGILSEFLKEHRAEVSAMLTTEFNIDIALDVVREEADAKWQTVLADKDAKLADKDAKLADKDLEIAQLRAKLEELQPS
jgi:hypothetical protein